MTFDNPHEKTCYENASYFTAVRGARPRTRVKVRCADVAAARRWACDNFGSDGRTMVYAVTEDGLSAHICNV